MPSGAAAATAHPSPRNDGLARALVDETQDERRADDPAPRGTSPRHRRGRRLVHERGGGCAVPQAPQRAARPPAGAGAADVGNRGVVSRLDEVGLHHGLHRVQGLRQYRGAQPRGDRARGERRRSGRASCSVGTGEVPAAAKSFGATAAARRARVPASLARRSVFVSRCSPSAGTVSLSEPPNFAAASVTIQGPNAGARRGARQPRRREPRGGGESVECFMERLRKSAGVGGGAFGPALALLEEPFEPPRCSELHEGHRDAHQHAGGPPAIPHRGVQRKTPLVPRGFFNACRGWVFVFRSRFFSGARGRSGVVPRVRLERVKTSRDAMRIAGRLARRGRAPDASRIAIGDAKTRVARRGKAPARGSFRDGARKIFFGGTPRDAPAAP